MECMRPWVIVVSKTKLAWACVMYGVTRQGWVEANAWEVRSSALVIKMLLNVYLWHCFPVFRIVEDRFVGYGCRQEALGVLDCCKTFQWAMKTWFNLATRFSKLP